MSRSAQHKCAGAANKLIASWLAGARVGQQTQHASATSIVWNSELTGLSKIESLMTIAGMGGTELTKGGAPTAGAASCNPCN